MLVAVVTKIWVAALGATMTRYDESMTHAATETARYTETNPFFGAESMWRVFEYGFRLPVVVSQLPDPRCKGGKRDEK